MRWSDGRWYDHSCTGNRQAVCCDVRDLASVRNQAENQKVQELIPAGWYVWIGLFRDSWKWSDGSSSSFRYWLSGQPNNYGGRQDCAAADFSSSGGWRDENCDLKFPFICSGPDVPTSSKQVFRLRVSSSVDPNDPAVMEAMLKQIKQKLRDQGVNDDVKLSFRKQADGKAFHKEEKKKKSRKDEF
ncbi:C-type lectin domain family 4 member M-like [Centropristis striata]|uniref:C-type lectin domain family 4 member M-like n=1 Tax=Centropristis striata TaxID=184440 RepID=UPI0027E10336|nr:C-type lectin domain family 4 member M-like [Centropristis striata]